MLRAQLAVHEQLLQCVADKREAIRSADIAKVSDICGRENTLIQGLAEIEKQRLRLVGELTQSIHSKSQKPLTMNEISQSAAEPQRTRLLALTAQLREIVTELRAQSSIVRVAAETLSRHMSGIVQTVHSALSRARVYGERGRIAMGSQVQSMLDIKS